MSRALIKSLKKTVRKGTHAQASQTQVLDAREAALSLLHRSVRFQHDRLAIQRLLNAVQVGVKVDQTLWDYCQTAASNMTDPTPLQKLQRVRREVVNQAATSGSDRGS